MLILKVLSVVAESVGDDCYHEIEEQYGTQTVKMQFATGANKRKHLRCDRESANLSFDADNLKSIWCNFKLSASVVAKKNTQTMVAFLLSNFR